jgi:hypothetical protein
VAELVNKFHVKQDEQVYECTCYTLEDEATPKTVEGGSTWEIKNNGVVCYLGLWPKASDSVSEYSTPLTIKKNNVEYYVQTKVLNYFTVTITQSSNQTIKVTCGGETYTETFQALAGSQYTVVVEPAKGYTAGAPTSSTGYVNSNITISASPASKKQYLITIQQSANQTITVRVNNTTDYTSNFTANHGDTYTASIKANEGYTAGKLSSASGTITGALTISATAAEIIKCTITVTQPANGRIEVNSKTGTSFAINYGTSTKIEAIANSGYVVDALYVDPV